MLIDFLKAEFTKEELTAALKVIRGFKAFESQEEWLKIPFAAWTKLEQLEEYVAHRAAGEKLREDTIAELERLGRLPS